MWRARERNLGFRAKGIQAPEDLLAIGELAAPLELRAEEPHDGVDHDEREGPVVHLGCRVRGGFRF